MTYLEYSDELKFLVSTLNPSKWTQDQERAYYEVFKDWHVAKWRKTIKEAILNWHISGRMPTPFQLREYGGESESKGHGNTMVKGLLPQVGCDRCERGMLHFQAAKEGIYYDRYAACDCPSGDRIAKHMVQMAKASGKILSESQVRYNFLMHETY